MILEILGVWEEDSQAAGEKGERKRFRSKRQQKSLVSFLPEFGAAPENLHKTPPRNLLGNRKFPSQLSRGRISHDRQSLLGS